MLSDSWDANISEKHITLLRSTGIHPQHYTVS